MELKGLKIRKGGKVIDGDRLYRLNLKGDWIEVTQIPWGKRSGYIPPLDLDTLPDGIYKKVTSSGTLTYRDKVESYWKRENGGWSETTRPATKDESLENCPICGHPLKWISHEELGCKNCGHVVFLPDE